MIKEVLWLVPMPPLVLTRCAAQVRHRCACSVKEVCGEEARLASFLSKEGRMTPLGTGLEDAVAAQQL